MKNQVTKKALLEAYRVPGFKALARVDGYEHLPPIFAITLVRRQKNDMQWLRKKTAQFL